MHCFLIKCMYWIFFHFNLTFLIFCNKVYVFEICMKKIMCSLLVDLLSQLPAFSSPQFIFYYSIHEVLSMETEGLILVKTEHLRHHLGFPQQSNSVTISTPDSASPLHPVSSTQMLHKATALQLLVFVPAKMKGTQGVRVEYVFIQRQEMSTECMTRPLEMQVRNVLVNIRLLSLVKIWYKFLTIILLQGSKSYICTSCTGNNTENSRPIHNI